MSDAWQKKFVAMLPEPVRADLKKSAILAGLTLAMAGVMLRQFAFNGPSHAAGAAVAPVAPSPPDRSAGRRASGKPQVGAVSAWLSEPIKVLERNLFEFKPEFFPRASETTVAARVVEDDLFWDQLAKSMSAQADSKRQRQIRVDNLQQAASKLRVQSTIMGTAPRAMVDGRMTRLGGTVEADAGGTGGASNLTFKLIRIDARRIVIERDGIQIEVPMGTGRARVLNETE